MSLAAEALAEAETLIQHSMWRGAINRYGHAAFCATRALLAIHDLDARDERGTIALFREHLVNTGVVPADVAIAVNRSFDTRQAADYADFTDPSREDVDSMDNTVRAFVRFCERFVRDRVKPAPFGAVTSGPRRIPAQDVASR